LREIHLKDLAAVVIRHWFLVSFLALLVGGGAFVTGRRIVPQYQSNLAIQVNSPKQVFARLDDIDIDEFALRTDPILSEALVLTTQGLALRVVDQLQLRLQMTDPTVQRGGVLSAITVDSLAPNGRYTLVLNGPAGYELRDALDSVITSGLYTAPAEGAGFSFTVLPSTEQRELALAIVSAEQAASRVSAGLTYTVRSGTNAVDIAFTGTDPTLVPFVLNAAAAQLRLDGARRAREIAGTRRQYIADQLSRVDSAFRDKLADLQAFKEGQRITDLSTEEQAIVQSIRQFEQQRQFSIVQLSTIREAMGQGDSIGIETLNRLAAVEGIGANAALNFQIHSLLRLYDERRTLTAGALGLRENNPQVSALNERLQQGHEALVTAVDAAVRSLEARLAALDSKINEERAVLATFPGKATQIAQLELESNILNDTYRYLLGQYEGARMQEATIAPYIEILDGAAPAYRVGTTVRQKVILGVLVGLLLGLAGAFFLEYLDQTVKSSADIERVLGVPVLGLIPHDPKLMPHLNGRRSPVVAINKLDVGEPAVESYRALRTNVTFVGADRPLQFITITSPSPREGKTTTAVNLAITLAQSGRRTLLIDGDLRRPQAHRAFGLVHSPGLTDVLVGDSSPREAVRPDIVENLDMLPSGSVPPNPSELLGSDAMHSLIGQLRHDYDYLIMDTPPTLPVTDASIIATTADAAILVVRSGDTEESAAQRALEQLRHVRARIAGAVLNAVTHKRDREYTYYYSYGRPAPSRSPLRVFGSRFANPS
jgi:capsular exopolysaccharide synthesis family protein